MLNSKPVKIAHLTTLDFSPRVCRLNQLRYLREMGFEVTAISSHESDNLWLEPEEIRHITIPLTGTLGPLAGLISLWKLWRVMRQEGFTIVHLHTNQPGLLGQLAARLAGVPIVVKTIHGVHFPAGMNRMPRRFSQLVEKIADRFSDLTLSANREVSPIVGWEHPASPARAKRAFAGVAPSKVPEWFEEELVFQKVKAEYARLLKQLKPAKAWSATRELPPTTKPAAFL